MTNADEKAQGCPVNHGTGGNEIPSRSAWSSWFGSSTRAGPSQDAQPSETSTEGCPVKHSTGSPGGCPVNHEGGSSSFTLPASIEEAARHAQSPMPDQRIPLSTQRVVSSIPRADELRNEQAAPHQPEEGDKWVYPSEQQFYNAMRRKGWQGVDEATVPFVVRIHNAVNERGWAQVQRWESLLHGNENPRLVRFLGRPQDMSPRAFLNTYVFWYNPPFDRHDWYVDRGDDKPPRRYVIDFYNGGDRSSNGSGIVSTLVNRVRGNSDENQQDSLPQRPPSMYLDVRPALDSPEAFSDRLKMFFIDGFPGIYAAFKQNSAQLPAPQLNVQNKTATEKRHE